jgi:phosphoribosylformimino-5-aminoimidazole carboxamide ribotide isomerase
VQIIPAIDLRGGRCVRLAQGQKDKSKIYSDDPVAVAQHFADAGAELVHIVDLDGAFSEGQSLNRSIVKEIVERVQVPIQFGGGLRTIDDVETLIKQGVTRVVLGTLATKSAETLKDLVDRFGSKICVGIDARNGVVMVDGWQAATSMSILDFAVAIARLGVERIIYTDIERDGMLNGPNIEQTVTVARQAGVHVTASGGVSRLEDIEKLREAGEPLIDSVIVGRALYEKRFTLEEALQAATR